MSTPPAPASMFLHESLVARHVNEGEVDVAWSRVGEAKIDGDAARLFFLQAIGIGAGQGAYERALAMVDVTRRANDNGTHRVSTFPSRRSFFPSGALRPLPLGFRRLLPLAAAAAPRRAG